MSESNIVSRVQIKYYDSGTIISNYSPIRALYSPNDDKIIYHYNFFSEDKLNEYLKEVDSDDEELYYYITLKPVVIFNELNCFVFNGGSDIDEEGINDEDLDIIRIWEDIQKDIKGFNKYGVCEITKDILYKSFWWSDYWGESDYSISYIGIINDLSDIAKLEEKYKEELRSDLKNSLFV